MLEAGYITLDVGGIYVREDLPETFTAIEEFDAAEAILTEHGVLKE